MAAKRSNKAVVDKLNDLFERLDAGLTPAQRKASLSKLEAVANQVRARAKSGAPRATRASLRRGPVSA